MSLARKRTITGAWIVLMAITAASVGTAELASDRPLAVGIVMAIAAVKGGVILGRFMEIGSAPRAVRYYLVGWTIACAVVIAALFRVAGR